MCLVVHFYGALSTIIIIGGLSIISDKFGFILVVSLIYCNLIIDYVTKLIKMLKEKHNIFRK